MSEKVQNQYNAPIYNTHNHGDGQTVVASKDIVMNQDLKKLENINGDQRQEIEAVIAELLNRANELSGNGLAAIGKTKDALNNPLEEKSNNLLKSVWSGLREIGSFTKDITPVGEFVIKNKDAIVAAISTAVSTFS